MNLKCPFTPLVTLSTFVTNIKVEMGSDFSEKVVRWIE